MSRGELPRHLQQARKRYRLGYLAVNASAVLLVGNIPGTFLWDKEAGETADGVAFSVFLAEVGLSILAFFVVQGSDPGYLSADRNSTRFFETEEEAVFTEAESEVKHHHEEDQEEDSPMVARRPLLAGTATNRDRVPFAPHVEEEGRTPAVEFSNASSSNGNNRSTTAIGSVNSSAAAAADIAAVPAGGEVSLWRTDFVRCARCENMKVPLRSHHCRECGLCVATFDHHCKVIGTCIGERNHCRFWWFLLAQTLSLGEAIRITVSGFSGHGASGMASTAAAGVGWVSRNALALLSSACLWPCLVLTATLLVTHSWMAMSSLTSYECLKGGAGRGSRSLRYLEGTRDFDLPFSEGLLGNLRGFCCSRDDGLRGVVTCGERRSWPFDDEKRTTTTTTAAAAAAAAMTAARWKPKLWKLPEQIVRDSEDWRSNLWENKYWSCC